MRRHEVAIIKSQFKQSDIGRGEDEGEPASGKRAASSSSTVTFSDERRLGENVLRANCE